MLEKALYCTPFPYQMYFPVSIYMGRVTGSALVQGLAAQAAWVAFAWFMAWFAWRRGIKKYAAVGG